MAVKIERLLGSWSLEEIANLSRGSVTDRALGMVHAYRQCGDSDPGLYIV